MRIGVVGAGSVGSSAAFAFVMRGLVSRLTVVDADRERAEGHALDLAPATAFSHPARILAGDVGDLEGSVSKAPTWWSSPSAPVRVRNVHGSIWRPATPSATLDPHLDAAERAALTASTEVMRDVLDRLR